MLKRLPEFIDPIHLVERHQGFKGSIAIAKMKRLASLLAETTGNVELEIQFDRDSAGIAIATGKVIAALKLPCQRCLMPMEFKVDSSFALGVVTSLAEARSLPENYEPLMVEHGNVLLADLVEDEILLALPAIAMHSEQCLEYKRAGGHSNVDDPRGTQPQKADSLYNAPTVEHGVADKEKPNPFAVLADLKDKLTK